jgi:HEXXH motif-containing protein
VLTAYRLAGDDLASVAADGGANGALDRLLAAAHSSRLILLRAVLDQASADPDTAGPLPDPARAWRLLAAAEARNRATVRKLLDHPEIGIWAAYTLRRLNTGLSHDAPVWVDTGHLHTIAATAAILTGLPCRTSVPLRDGQVVLPTLGLATFPTGERWQVAELISGPTATHLHAGSTTVRLPADPTRNGPGWQPMHRLRLGELAVWLDDLDPYRGFFRPLRPEPLTATDRAEWTTLLSRSWSLLVRDHPIEAARLRDTMTVVVPAGRPRQRFRPWSSSCADGVGAAAVTLPDSPAVLASMLVHEHRHNLLNALLDLVPLHEDDWAERYYAPWRDDPRPIGGLLHGCYSFMGVADFWRTHRTTAPAAESAAAEFEFALRHHQIQAALHTLTTSDQLTEPGRRFVAELRTVVAGWQADADTVAGPVAALARRAAADHRATWRLRHLRPRQAVVDGLARSWQRGDPPGPWRAAEPTVYPDRADPNEPRARTHLTQLRLSTNPSDVDDQIPATSAADLLLVNGNPLAAAPAYRSAIAREPADVSPWIGLGLALTELGDPAGDTLLDRPEVVHALHRRLADPSATPPDAEAVARWLS